MKLLTYSLATVGIALLTKVNASIQDSNLLRTVDTHKANFQSAEELVNGLSTGGNDRLGSNNLRNHATDNQPF